MLKLFQEDSIKVESDGEESTKTEREVEESSKSERIVKESGIAKGEVKQSSKAERDVEDNSSQSPAAKLKSRKRKMAQKMALRKRRKIAAEEGLVG